MISDFSRKVSSPNWFTLFMNRWRVFYKTEFSRQKLGYFFSVGVLYISPPLNKTVHLIRNEKLIAVYGFEKSGLEASLHCGPSAVDLDLWPC